MSTAVLYLLPACEAGAEQTWCAVDGGALTYVRGAWRHLADTHAACDVPEPERCPHACGQVVAVDTKCAHDRGRCCGCCWIPRHETGACR